MVDSKDLYLSYFTGTIMRHVLHNSLRVTIGLASQVSTARIHPIMHFLFSFSLSFPPSSHSFLHSCSFSHLSNKKSSPKSLSQAVESRAKNMRRLKTKDKKWHRVKEDYTLGVKNERLIETRVSLKTNLLDPRLLLGQLCLKRILPITCQRNKQNLEKINYLS